MKKNKKNAYLVDNLDGTFSVVVAKGFKPKKAVAIVPSEVDPSDYPFIVGQEVSDQEGVRIEPVIDSHKKGEFLTDKQKQETKKVSLEEYLSDVNRQMSLVFGTTNRETTTALYLTWMMMESMPEFYADKGLEDDLGDPLDTVSKVFNFAKAKIRESLDYSVYLMKRRQKYINEIKSLG